MSIMCATEELQHLICDAWTELGNTIPEEYMTLRPQGAKEVRKDVVAAVRAPIQPKAPVRTAAATNAPIIPVAAPLPRPPQRAAVTTQNTSPTATNVTHVTNNASYSTGNVTTGTSQETGIGDCIICAYRKINAVFSHGETSHSCCCIECAREVRDRGNNKCPICNARIEMVTQNFTV